MFEMLTRFFNRDNTAINRIDQEAQQLRNSLEVTQTELKKLRLLEKIDLSNIGRTYKGVEISFVDPKGTKEIDIILLDKFTGEEQSINLDVNEAKTLLSTLQRYFGDNE